MTPVQSALWTVLGVALVISVVTDVLRRRILDVVTYPLMVIALGGRLWADGVGDLEKGLISGLVSGVGLAVVLVPGALRGKMGLALLGGVVGLVHGASFLCSSAVVGASWSSSASASDSSSYSSSSVRSVSWWAPR